MKTAERHRLKENEVAIGLEHARQVLQSRGRPLLVGLIAVAVIAAAIGGYWYWQKNRNERAALLLAEARRIESAAIVPQETPAEGSTATPSTPPPGSYPTEAARNEAALAKYRETATAFPNTVSGIAAQFHLARLLAEMGKTSEAEQAFEEVVRRDGNGLHGRMARLGIASIQIETGRYDPAIQTLNELSQRTDTDLPVDGILMQLGDAYARAGRIFEAVSTYTRIAEDFPESPFASDARAEVDRLKAGTPRA
ncbi:MAG TPA: tetratricopeptide repeat protein [Vicinamibacterales bacterium]